jgi:hypothetical protein
LNNQIYFMVQEMTTKQYAAIREVSPVAVTRAMNKKKSLIGVGKNYKKVRRDWILLVDKKEASKKPKKNLVISK